MLVTAAAEAAAPVAWRNWRRPREPARRKPPLLVLPIIFQLLGGHLARRSSSMRPSVVVQRKNFIAPMNWCPGLRKHIAGFRHRKGGCCSRLGAQTRLPAGPSRGRWRRARLPSTSAQIPLNLGLKTAAGPPQTIGMLPRIAPWTTLGSGRSRMTRAAGALPCRRSWWRIAPGAGRAAGQRQKHTQPRRQALRTLGMSPVTRPVRMSTSPKKEIGSSATSTGPAPAPATRPRP